MTNASQAKPDLPEWITVDSQGVYHFDMEKLCEIYGISPNEHNLDMLTQAATEYLKKRYPHLPITIVEDKKNKS